VDNERWIDGAAVLKVNVNRHRGGTVLLGAVEIC